MFKATILLLLATTITAQDSAYCQQTCQGQISVVCGTNGVTYRSICELQCNGFSILYRGACQPSTATNTGSGSSGTFGTSSGSSLPFQGLPQCVNLCQGLFAIVCGSDGVTYQSPCAMTCTSSATTIVSPGACPTSNTSGSGSGSGTIFGNGGTGGTVGTAAPSCASTCTAGFSPVCGADGNTYTNACYAGCASTTVSYSGVCQGCSSACPTYISYVCGSNGVTYQNQCFLVCNGNTQVASYGQCP